MEAIIAPFAHATSAVSKKAIATRRNALF